MHVEEVQLEVCLSHLSQRQSEDEERQRFEVEGSSRMPGMSQNLVVFYWARLMGAEQICNSRNISICDPYGAISRCAHKSARKKRKEKGNMAFVKVGIPTRRGSKKAL